MSLELPDTNLFEPPVPPGFRYQPDFISDAEEAALVEAIAAVSFSNFEMRGVVARRRVAFFGESYDGAAARPIPAFLMDLRARVASWSALDLASFAMVLINEYRPGAPIGWHRDAPQYDAVAGVSLLSPCQMKFRRYVRPDAAAKQAGRRNATHAITLRPRSAYLMVGEARRNYEHHIPAVRTLRYSITFRTRQHHG